MSMRHESSVAPPRGLTTSRARVWRAGPGLSLLAAAALGLLTAGRAAGKIRNPCPESSAFDASAAAATGAGYLVIKVDSEQVLGKPVLIDGRRAASLPRKKAQCVWLQQASGDHQVQIQGIPEGLTLTIGTGRNNVLTISESLQLNPGGAVDNVAVRVQGPVRGLRDTLRARLLDLAAHGVSDVLAVSEENSSTEPMTDPEVQQLLARPRAPCDLDKFRSAEVQYIAIFQVMEAERPGAGTPYRVRVYHAGIGAESVAAEETQVIQDGPEAERLMEDLFRGALKKATERTNACLQLTSQPPGSRVTLALPQTEPQSSGGAPPQGLPLLLGKTPLERRVFFDQNKPHEVIFELPGFHPQSQRGTYIDFDSKPIHVKLDRIPGPPLYKRWWFWQIVATTVFAGVTGVVAGVYAGDGGAR